MEIYSIRSSQNLLFRNDQKGRSRPEDTAQPSKNTRPVFQVAEDDPQTVDFTAISVVQIREIARRSFDQGQIDHDTFSTLYEGLPTHTIDPAGRVIDLSEVTDTTPFDFKSYYQDQLRIASSIGDPRTASILQSVVSFLNAHQA